MQGRLELYEMAMEHPTMSLDSNVLDMARMQINAAEAKTFPRAANLNRTLIGRCTP